MVWNWKDRHAWHCQLNKVHLIENGSTVSNLTTNRFNPQLFVNLLSVDENLKYRWFQPKLWFRKYKVVYTDLKLSTSIYQSSFDKNIYCFKFDNYFGQFVTVRKLYQWCNMDYSCRNLAFMFSWITIQSLFGFKLSAQPSLFNKKWKRWF